MRPFGGRALAAAVMERRVRSGLAHRLAAQTLLGTARRLLHKGQHPAPLRGDVRMPSGSTAIHRLPATGSTGQSRAVQTAVRSRVAVEAHLPAEGDQQRKRRRPQPPSDVPSPSSLPGPSLRTRVPSSLQASGGAA